LRNTARTVSARFLPALLRNSDTSARAISDM